ncbi:MAG: aspartate/methionine/tyrosine aminotransferase [Pseudohongiellaceae bacterium]|jgi:aspartate/methionine/tyrosine aminotransferase
MKKLPSAIEKVSPFRVMSVMERALQLEKAGRKIVHMEVGEPDFCTASPIIDAGKNALDAGRTHYTSATGLEELRIKISQFYETRNGVSVDPRRILITPGASGGLSLLAHMLVGPGDGVLLTDPAYPCVRNFIHLMNAQPQLMPVTMANNFQPSLADYEKHVQANTKGLWLASPSNPTGTIMERAGLVQASQWTHKHQLHLLVDEIYHGLHYVEDMPSILEVDESAFVVNSFSKYFGMTGWRLGWIVVPKDYIETATKLAQNLYISASTIAQYAALAAFTEEAETIFEQRRQAFKQRRDFLAAALREMGFKIPEKIQGAFYIYADISAFSANAEEFCRALIEDQGVAITPGADFGHYLCDRYVRIAFTTSMADLELGVERLRSALVK